MNPAKFTRWRFVLVLIEPNYNQKLKTQFDAAFCVCKRPNKRIGATSSMGQQTSTQAAEQKRASIIDVGFQEPGQSMESHSLAQYSELAVTNRFRINQVYQTVRNAIRVGRKR